MITGSNLNVIVFRHGEAMYKQGKVSLNESNDLTVAGKDKVRKQARKIGSNVKSDEKVSIWCSPFGRTLETAKIITDELKMQGIAVRAIKIFDVFEEVRNFDVTLFSIFVNGGEIDCNGEKMVFIKNQVNSENLSWVDYFNQRAWGLVDEKIKRQIPGIFDKLNSIETEDESDWRIQREFNRLKKIHLKRKTKLIIVTHQGVMSGLTKEKVEPGDFVEVL